MANNDGSDEGIGTAEADKNDARTEGAISDGPNARPRDETISQSGPGLPDDSSLPVEITPEEEARITERIKNL